MSGLGVSCFEAKTQEGLQCSQSGACPKGQSCQQGTCYRLGNEPIADAAIDATLFTCSTETLASGQESATGLDARDSDYVYWTANAGTQIFRSPKVTGSLQVFHDAGLNKHPFGVATDETHVYWTESEPLGRVMRKPKISVEADPAEELAIGQGEPSHLALDGTHIYWANRANGSINRILKAGGAVEGLASSQGVPNALAVDETRVYWASAATGQIMSSDKSGLGQQQLAGAQGGPQDIALSTDSVYWTASEGSELRGVGKGGGAVRTEVSGQSGASALAVADGYLYWSNSGTGQIMRSELASITPQQLVDGQSEPVSLQLEGGQLYWLNALDASNRLVRGACNSL